MAIAAAIVSTLVWTASATTQACANTATLNGSAFEIDVNANLAVNTSGCIDWLTGNASSGYRSGVLPKNDKPTGAGDDSFGQGTAEDNPNPTIVTGSIPPNKSDLKAFGVFTEAGESTTANPTGKFLELFWSRVQNPSGTTNMDFELNKILCDGTPTNCANNGTSKNPIYKTPKRSAGDKLITYDLSRGGTVPSISIRTWTGSVWGAPTVISGTNDPLARGSVNTTAFSSTVLGQQDAFTFGEASIAFKALFGDTTCGSFGSAYLKSRSSDSFSAEIKDFVEPESVEISNCTTLTTGVAEPSVTIGSKIHDTATLSGATSTATGTITFKVYGPFTGADPTADTCVAGTLLTTISSGITGPDANGDFSATVEYTPTAIGRYRWVATYSGDNSNVAAGPTECLDAAEVDTVVKRQPTLTTSAAESVIVGNDIHDTATLAGATADAGGTITFKVYGPFTGADPTADTCVAGTLLSTIAGSALSGPDGSGNFTSTATYSGATTVARYRWVATYSGDAKNESAGPTACLDPAEVDTVTKKQPAISTGSAETVVFGNDINDTATISGATSDATGTVTFTVYGPFTDATPGDDACVAGTLLTTLGPVTIERAELERELHCERDAHRPILGRSLSLGGDLLGRCQERGGRADRVPGRG